MSDENERPERIWLEAFQESQRQMASAHNAYQDAMARSHQAFMHAIAESQAQLADVLQGRVSADELQAIFAGQSLPAFDAEDAPIPVVRRFVPTAESRALPGEPLTDLTGRSWAIVKDEMGVAQAVQSLLNARGVEATLCESPTDVPDVCDALLVLGGVRDFQTMDESAQSVRDAVGLVSRLTRLEHGVCVLVQDTGGRFGLDVCEAAKALSSGLFALGKVLATAWPDAQVKSIDLDVGYRQADEVAHDLVTELFEGGHQHVGLPEGARVVRFLEESELIEGTGFAFGGVALCTVSGEDSSLALLEGLAAWPDAKLILLGRPEDRALVELAVGSNRTMLWIDLDLSDLMGLFDAVESARESLGAIGAVFQLNSGGGERIAELDAVMARRVSTLQAILALTAGDPVRRLAIATSFDAGPACTIVDEMLRKLALAEKARRGDECLVKAITIDTSEEAIAAFWDELTSDSDDVEVYLQRVTGVE